MYQVPLKGLGNRKATMQFKPDSDSKIDLLGLERRELEELASALGEKPFRGRQLYHQLYRRRESDLEGMTELSRQFRKHLAERCVVRLPRLARRQDSRDGTVKFLLALVDGRFVESVLIPEEKRDTLCISSQVGCAVDCKFCLTARMGFERNLRPGEIIGQILVAIREGCLPQRGFNLVFMGMGEPLYNYRNLMKAIRIVTDPGGMALSHRRITVSTSGVVPVLRKMQKEPVLPNLAISINATTEERRSRLMPINERWSMEELLGACREFPLDPRRRITFEYILMAGESDSDADARRLAELLKGMRAKVNLIPYNPNPGLPFRRPAADRVDRFREILAGQGLSAFVRRPRGDDISAACGQLAYLEEARV